MSNLQTRTKNVRCVINFPIEKEMIDICENLTSSGYQFAMITHDKDTNDNGEFKTKHIHLLLISPKNHQLQYYLYRLANTFSVKENQVSVQVSESTTHDIQYLIHKNDPSKYQYDKSYILHNLNNDFLQTELETLCESKINIGTLVAIVRNSKNNIEIMERIGLQRYTLYRNVIRDIKADM